MTVLSFFLALGFALVHIFIGALVFLHGVPRSRWLSGAGGVAVAYIFLHLLPELAAHQRDIFGVEESEAWIYLVALAGLAGFYGLERAARVSRGRSRDRGGPDRVEDEVFLIHIGSFAVYNVLIGYLLLHREESGPWLLLAYFVAMALHFVTNDFGLREDHKDRYDRQGRWLLAGAVLLGWLLGLVADLPPAVIGFLFAILAGGVVLNVLKEELPEERKSSFGAFALGTAGYAALLLLA